MKSADHPGIRGYDAGDKINGRKRHVLVDEIDLLLEEVETPASKQDRTAAQVGRRGGRGR